MATEINVTNQTNKVSISTQGSGKVSIDLADEEDSLQISEVKPQVNISIVSPSINILEGAQQGLQGVPGNAFPPIPFAYDNVSPRVVYTVPNNTLIVTITIAIQTFFNGVNPSLKVGIVGDVGLLLDETDINPAFEADYSVNNSTELLAGTEIIITTVGGAGGTQGGGYLILELLEV